MALHYIEHYFRSRRWSTDTMRWMFGIGVGWVGLEVEVWTPWFGFDTRVSVPRVEYLGRRETSVTLRWGMNPYQEGATAYRHNWTLGMVY